MVREFSKGDEGNTVMTADGENIGTVETIDGDMAHVKPDSGLTQSIRQKLGWTDENEEMYELDHSSVARITGTEVHLK